MSGSLKILTFNWHEPYICMLAKTGHMFDAAEPERGRGHIRKWDERFRRKPSNLSVVSLAEGLENADKGLYDLVLCHNFLDLKLVENLNTPAILIFHNKLGCELALGGDTVDRQKYLEDVSPLAERAKELVFVSESKRADWGFGRGVVVPPGIDRSEFHSYVGDNKIVFRVASLIRERGIMLGYNIQEKICGGFETKILGYNPSIDNSQPAESWEALKSYYAHGRVFLNVTLAPYEDGYNLAMLEAMASGCPVVSYAHHDSPITDGVNGYISDDIDILRTRIKELLENIDLAKKIGENGKKTALEKFPIEKFVDRWKSVFHSAIGKRRAVCRSKTDTRF